MTASAVFNGVVIGDVVTNVMAGNIARDVVVDSVLDVDGVITRTRGGVVQHIVVEAYRECESFLQRLGYLEELFAELGNVKATLTVSDEAGERSWTDCLPAEVKELEGVGAFVRFECRFVR